MDNLNYKPGVCNIGKNEIKKRYLFGIEGFVLFFFVVLVTRFYPLQFSFLFLFISSLVGFEGIFQGHFRFCATFGLLGIYDFRGTSNEHGGVIKDKDRKKDVKAAILIHVYSLIGTVIITLVATIF